MAHLVLVDQSGAKQSIPQPSTARAMLEAERAIRRLGRRLREVKVISRNHAVARWKADELHWHRMP
jgi:diadenosine tetraphosphate (Ap4A) HIT family hydrolase